MVIVNVNGIEYYMDGYLKDNLDLLKNKVKQDWDFVIPISGSAKTRIGKSVFGQQIAKYLDPNFTINNIFFTAGSLKKEAIKMKKYSAVIYDEARRGLSSKRALEQFSKDLCEFLDDVAQLNLFIIVILPDFFDLNKDIAIGRSIAMVNVYYKGNLERGYFSFFNDERKKKLYLWGKKSINYECVTPNFRGRFTDFYVVPELEYRKRKKEYLMKKEEGMYDRWQRRCERALLILSKVYNVNFRDLAYSFGYSSQTMPGFIADLVEKYEDSKLIDEINQSITSIAGNISNSNLKINNVERKKTKEKGKKLTILEPITNLGRPIKDTNYNIDSIEQIQNLSNLSEDNGGKQNENK